MNMPMCEASEVQEMAEEYERDLKDRDAEIERLRERASDLVELVAEKLYNTEPKPPGPPTPPFGSHSLHKSVWEPYRKKAREFLRHPETSVSSTPNGESE